jgi:hypothetical protein
MGYKVKNGKAVRSEAADRAARLADGIFHAEGGGDKEAAERAGRLADSIIDAIQRHGANGTDADDGVDVTNAFMIAIGYVFSNYSADVAAFLTDELSKNLPTILTPETRKDLRRLSIHAERRSDARH